MEKNEIGMLAKSKAGHDKDHVYVIFHADKTYVYLVDGILKTIDRPKRKKRKHIQMIHEKFDVSAADDVAIKRILTTYTNRVSRDAGLAAGGLCPMMNNKEEA